MKTMLQTSGLQMTYKIGKVEVPALRGIDLAVREGEFVAIMGPSGCGKSTLLHLIGGLLKPTAGKIIIDGMNIVALKDYERTELRRKRIGFIFQRFNLLSTLTAKQNLDLARKIHGNGYFNGDESEEILRVLGLKDKMHHKPLELSGGEQQRVALARAVINKPAIILADEPTGSLDSANSQIILKMFREMNQRYNQTIIMITHDSEAAAMASRIVEMRDGQIVSRVLNFYHDAELNGVF
jgi:putative ABC transport system ATP-binding protein